VNEANSLGDAIAAENHIGLDSASQRLVSGREAEAELTLHGYLDGGRSLGIRVDFAQLAQGIVQQYSWRRFMRDGLSVE